MAKKVLSSSLASTTLVTKDVLAKNTSAIGAKDFSSLESIADLVSTCTLCKLCENRTHAVPGEGNPHPELMFIGEGPGESEDLQGRPFVGASGQLLDKMIEAMGVKRADVFISNIVKCRPPENRKPLPEEVSACLPYLTAQIRLLKPKVIVALGSVAAQNLLGVETPVSKLRGKVMEWDGMKLIVSFHPSYLLRTPAAKKDSWEDLKLAMKELGWSGPKKN